MKKYINFCKNNMELVTGVTIILILSNFVILKIAFEKNNVFAGVFFSAIPYVIAMELMFFGIGLRKKTEEKGIFEVSSIFLCIIFIFALILTLIGIIKFAYEDDGRK